MSLLKKMLQAAGVRRPDPVDLDPGQVTPADLAPRAFAGICPVCDCGKALMAGPGAMLSQNVMCMYCGTRVNLTPAIGMYGIDWTHGPQSEIWNGLSPTVFPDEAKVIERKNMIHGLRN